MLRFYGPVSKFLIFTIFSAGIVVAENPDLKVRCGFGYDYISQEFYIDSLKTSGGEIELKSALLKKNYLNDVKGFLLIDYGSQSRYQDSTQYRFDAGWEQTSKTCRALGKGYIEFGNPENRVRPDFKVEFKRNYKGKSDPGDELFVGLVGLNYIREWSNSLESTIRLFTEKVVFDSTSLFIYNYSRIGGRLGLNILTADFNSIHISTELEKRNVSDSGIPDYIRVRGNISYLGMVASTRLSADLGFENRNYNEDNNRRDYSFLTFYSNLSSPLGEVTFLKPTFSLEYFDFKLGNNVYSDYFLARLALLTAREIGDFTPAIGPELELLSSRDAIQNNDDYFEFALSTGFDYFKLNGAFLIFKNQIGRRKYKKHSDFTFDRISFITSQKIIGNLSLDIFFSAGWEWHEVDSDDNRLYLISTSVTYIF